MYAPTRGTQDHDPRLFYKAYEKIVQKKYPGQETMVGAQFWGQNELEVRGQHNEVLFHTGLLGQAAHLGDDLRAPVPMATYEKADQIIAGYSIIGVGYEYYPQELEDDLFDTVAPKVADLPILLADREEDEHFAPYNNGDTTFESGWANTPLFVDGSSDYLQIIGQQGVNYGSNIINYAGGVSYHLISLYEQYGDHFVNEEGRLSPIRAERIMCSHQNARLFELFFGAGSNIEQNNPAIPNPVRSRPTVIPTHRLFNPNRIIVFFEGWQEDLKERSKWRARTQSDTIGHLNQEKVVTITRSRFSYYFFFNRRVLLIEGRAPNA
jgi:hypothetical protein